jgi:hypothetical protein
MTSPYLPDDCIYYILKYLQPYHSSLFKCILVNRFWCRTTIPLLYANPFIYTNKNIILTFILCFSKAEILQLKNQIKLFGIENININDNYKPLFEYPKYLKNYDCLVINSTILEWFKDLSYSLYKQENEIIENFCPTFHQSILSRCINVKQFSISIDFIDSNPNFNIPTSNLTKLYSLSLNSLMYNDQKIEKEFLDNMAMYCLNLKELKVSSSMWIVISLAITENLCTLIQKQNNLEKFSISYYLFNNILFSLEFQKHSLVFIEFSNIDFCDISFKNFINFYNLNHLIFSNCKDTKPLDKYEILQFASFKLKKLEFNGNYWNETIVIIKYLGTSLQCLSINETLSIPMIKNVSKYCLNLIILEITTHHFKFNDILVFPYFKNLRISKLYLTIDGISEVELTYDGIREILINLANNLSINVKEITFKFYQYDQPLLFLSFLANCHNYLEKINFDYYINSEIFKIILHYIESYKNSLKILCIFRVKKVLNDKELNLLDKIKVKGINVFINL